MNLYLQHIEQRDFNSPKNARVSFYRENRFIKKEMYDDVS